VAVAPGLPKEYVVVPKLGLIVVVDFEIAPVVIVPHELVLKTFFSEEAVTFERKELYVVVLTVLKIVDMFN